MKSVEVTEIGPLECSPETPWGLHPAVMENVCPRCGWVAREISEDEAAALPGG
jgi:hypothetical protein